jgi:hypothetical protein
LRAARAESSRKRKRIEQGKTADRAGRTVFVERLISAQSKEERQGKRRKKKSAAVGAGSATGSKEKAPPRSQEKTTFGGRVGPRAGSQPRPPRRKS